MKKLNFKPIFLMAIAALSFTACKKDKGSDPIKPVINDGAEMAKLFRSAGPQFQSFSIDAATGAVITTTNGTKFHFPANAFTKGGSPVSGTVNVSIKEINDVSSMILADKPTITADGKMLESYGEFFVKAEQGGEQLALVQDSAVLVQVPARPPAAGGKEVPMWDGDSAVNNTVNGFNYQNNAVSITKTSYISKGIDWKQQTTNYAFFNIPNATVDFKLFDLLRWVNCDALYNLPGTKTTVMCYFTNHYNTTTGSNYSGEEPSMLYFKPRGVNSMIKFYNTIMSSPAGYEGFHSYQTSIPAGLEGTFLAMSSVDGKYYAEMKDITIADPGAASYTAVSFNLQEVSSSALLSMVEQMETK